MHGHAWALRLWPLMLPIDPRAATLHSMTSVSRTGQCASTSARSPSTAARADVKAKGKQAPTAHAQTMFASQPPEGWMAECRQKWLNRLREEPPTDQAAPSQHTTFMAAAPSEHTCARSQARHSNFAAAPWENAGNPHLAGCSRPRCKSCGIILKTDELGCPSCPGSVSDEPPRSDEDVAELRRQRRKAQMRLVSLGRGDVKPRPGEPECLEILVAELGALLRQARGADGKFASRG